ncbi:hypothetical protein PSTG_14011 [Puccinia striiformis f. sp. tritici PST-78]|uniref:Uncharacterized protein n=1 Tax=Puccinia striiformis f. sp. tritici PST-78 TaxID=1165861 RepID=A0A0L0UZW3_9BASI|nr:hypothetical protein PSTG_14011 [Puccinia striiformis f. sp. tritici PST-78]
MNQEQQRSEQRYRSLNFNNESNKHLKELQSLVSRGAHGNGDTALTWASTAEGNLPFSEEDHRDVRLHYKTGIIPRLLYGETYSLGGCVLGGKDYEMLFLDCEQQLHGHEGLAEGHGEPPRMTGVGSVVGVFDLAKDGEDGNKVEVFVVHKVDEYTDFGDKKILVKYVLDSLESGSEFAGQLYKGQRGRFEGQFNGWSRQDHAMMVELESVTVSTP